MAKKFWQFLSLIEFEEANDGFQRLKNVGEVEDEADDGEADAEDGASEDDVQSQEVFASLA